MRPNNRENNQPRQIKITRNYTKHAEGSVLVEFRGHQSALYCNSGRCCATFLKRTRARLGNG